MKVTPEKLEDNKAKLTIEVPEERFEKSLNKAFKEVVKKLNVPGFRKGKAPRHIVEKLYGRELFLEDAIKDVIPEAFADAVKEAGEGFECVVYPSYDIISDEKGKGLVFSAEYDLKPQIKLGDYKGMKLQKVSEALEEDAVDKQLKMMQERFARLDEVAEPAKLGDVCVIDFLGKVDDVPFEGGAGTDYNLELGSNSFIPGFEEQLVDAKAGDVVDVKVTFPEEYRAKDLAGKDAVFEVTVKAVKRKILSELNDEFAKDVSEFETIEQLRADLAEKLSQDAKKRAEAEKERLAVDKAVEESEFTLPKSFLDIRMDQMIDNFAQQLAQQGIGFQQYLDITGTSPEALRDQFKDRAEKDIRTELVLEAIVNNEGIEITEEDLNEEFERLASQAKQDVAVVRSTYESNEEWADSVKYGLKLNKAVKILTQEAQYIIE
jgi:trigger factor